MILHMIVWDHPSVSSTRSQKAMCGIYSHPRAMAKDRESVTCPSCLEALKAEAAEEAAGPQTAEEMFGSDPVTPPVQSPRREMFEGHRPKGVGR